MGRQFAGAAQRGRSKRGMFGDSMAEVDGAVGAVLGAVRGTNTLAILSSDNGAPDAFQHRQVGPAPPRHASGHAA